MTAIPSFKTGAKPQLSEAEHKAAANAQQNSFISDPGTYEFLVKSITFKDTPSEKDNAWVSATVVLKEGTGKEIKHFILVPTECVNSFMYGEKKQAFAYQNLQQFLRGFGHVLNYDNTMNEVAEIFGNPDKYLVGKTIRAKVGFKGPHLKYLGKSADGVNQYQVVDKDHTTIKVDGTFADRKAAEQAAKDAGIKGAGERGWGFPEISEVFPAEKPLFIVTSAAAAVSIELPF